jgi:hypothetical protein
LIELKVLGSLARYGKQEMRRQGDEEIKETSLSPELLISCRSTRGDWARCSVGFAV